MVKGGVSPPLNYLLQPLVKAMERVSEISEARVCDIHLVNHGDLMV